MPLYDYICTECDTVQEKSHSYKVKNKESCEKCEAPAKKLKKQLSPIGPHISWSNWHGI